MKTRGERLRRSIPPWLSVSRPSMRHALWLTLPLGLQVILFKAIKFAVLTEHSTLASNLSERVPELLTEYLAVPLLGLVLTATIALLVKRLGAPAWLAIATFAAFVTLALYAMRKALLYELDWLSMDFLGVIRLDLVEVLILTVIVLLLIEHTGGRVRRFVLGGLHILIPSLMIFGIMEVGYFLETGSIADAFLLQYAVANISDLTYVMSSELTGTKLAVLALPIPITLFPLLRRRRSTETGRKRVKLLVPFLAAAALSLLLVPEARPHDQTAAISGGTYIRLLQGIVSRPVWENAHLVEGEEIAPIFDTRSLQAVPSDTVRDMNVVFIILESQRVSSYLPDGVTPFFDSLADKSVAIDRMTAIVPHTNKALVPILCGIYPRINQGEEPHIPGRCLPELLKPHGYRSAFFTPAALAFENKNEMIRNMGFDDYFGDAEYADKSFPIVNYFGREERIMLQPSLDWIDKQLASHTPFFLTYLTLTPHHPYAVPPSTPIRHFDVANEDYNNYLNAISFVDGFVAELFEGFDERGIVDKTLFVLLSDHGEAFGEHKLQFHSAVPYEEALHVPAIIFNPVLFPEPRTVGGWRQETDLVPTVTDLLGLELAGGTLPGVSVFDPVPEDRKLYHATWIENQSMALRVGSRKFIYHYRRKPIEVFDLDNDPFERNDLAHEYTEDELEGVEVELLTWRRRVNQVYEEKRGEN